MAAISSGSKTARMRRKPASARKAPISSGGSAEVKLRCRSSGPPSRARRVTMPGSCTGRPSSAARSTGSHATNWSMLPRRSSTWPRMPRPSAEETSCTSSEKARALMHGVRGIGVDAGAQRQRAVLHAQRVARLAHLEGQRREAELRVAARGEASVLGEQRRAGRSRRSVAASISTLSPIMRVRKSRLVMAGPPPARVFTRSPASSRRRRGKSARIGQNRLTSIAKSLSLAAPRASRSEPCGLEHGQACRTWARERPWRRLVGVRALVSSCSSAKGGATPRAA